MKKQEAIDLILSEQEKGTEKQEIIEILMGQEKIGNSKPTLEYVETLFPDSRVVEVSGGASDDDDDQAAETTQTPEQDGVSVYEKWQVEPKTHARIKKLKEVRIPDQAAEVMNQAAMGGRGYVIRYIKK